MEEVTVEIDRLGINGEGIGSLQGYRVFIDGALQGERVKASLDIKKKHYAKGAATQILTPSPYRIDPICPVFNRCGGCQLMHLKYHKQLEMKQQLVIDALERIGKLKDLDVKPCLPSPQKLAYRNKVQLPVTQHQVMGLYERGSHHIVEIEKCYIHTVLGEEAFQTIKERLKTHSLPDHLKTILIKSAIHTQEILVIFVTGSYPSPLLIDFAKSLIGPHIKGVIHNKNQESGNRILGPYFDLLAGKPTITELLCGLTLKVSPGSFFQVNPLQAENLYHLALEFADLKGTETVLDAFCGIGALSLLFAKKAKHVIGVEIVPDAIKDAKENALLNHVTNVHFECAPAEHYCKTLSALDVALINPPRKGCEKELIEHLIAGGPKKIIYISCDPATLARDLGLLSHTYRVEKVQPVDMFPQTSHVETVALCTKL